MHLTGHVATEWFSKSQEQACQKWLVEWGGDLENESKKKKIDLGSRRRDDCKLMPRG